jgi:hypothetical protein
VSVVLVSYDSAIEGRGNEKEVEADANHSTIAKMTKFQGSIYPRIREEIERGLMSTAQVKAALDQNSLKEVVISNALISSWDMSGV